MSYSSIVKKKCKCSITCDKPVSMSCGGYYVYHIPTEVKEKIEREKKAKEARQIGKVIRGIRKEHQDEGGIDSFMELKIDLDRVYSRWLRLANADKELKCECYTCGVRKHWLLMQCGHFIKRIELALRWSQENTKVQCKYCNENLDGNLEVYAENLEKERAGIVECLREQARETSTLTRSDLKEILFDYQQKLRTVENAKLK